MMRRLFLTLILLSVPGWSQPSAQRPTQPPIVVKVEMPPPPPRDFLGILQALGPLIAASVAVGVGVMQFFLQNRQFKQSLFERRYAVYDAIRKYRASVRLPAESQTPSSYDTYCERTQGSEFLFRKQAKEYIEEIGSLGKGLQSKLVELAKCIAKVKGQSLKHDASMTHYTERDVKEALADLDPVLTQLRKRLDALDNGLRRDLALEDDKTFLARLTDRLNRFVDDDVPAALASRYKD